MRKEAINTFQEGLNYDLNPITTPNNVLTDCVNGTFITFNGDELALQNDAGNTKILIPGTTDSYVKLSPGFYPLGIKEYGGVLYIVSGSKVPIDDSITDWDINTVYEIGQIVRFNNKFYINGIENNTNHIIESDLLIGEIDGEILLMEDGSQSLAENGWTELIIDSENYLNLIEFGSYPSPEFAGNRQFTNKISVNLSTEKEKLYYPNIANNEIFKSGRYVTFNSDPVFTDSTKTNWISHIDSTGKYAPRLYKVRLWHQLNNGLVDLTDDVMNKYKLFRSMNPSGKSLFWFNQSDFVYFCPNQYKGKLALSMEIEPMVSFKLFEFPTLKFEGNQYIFTIKVKGDSGINPTLVFSGISVKLIVDGVVKQNAGLLDDPSYITYDSENKAYIASLIIPNTDEYNNKIVKYEVVPSLSVVDPFSTENYEKDTYVDSFHEEFRKNYIITGERLITSKVSTIVFKLVDEECNTQTGIQTYRAAILTNASGQNLDNTLTPTEGIYAFVLDGYINSSYEVVGRYTINAQGKPSVMTDPVPSVSEDIIQVFQDEIVSFESSSCKQVIATIVTSNSVDLDDVSVTQGSEKLDITRIDDITYTCSVVPNSAFTIEISKPGFSTIYHSSIISTNKTIKLALIPKLTSEMWDSGIQGSYTLGVYWGHYDSNLSTINGIVSLAGTITLTSEFESRYSGTTTIKRLVNGINLSITSGTYFNGGDYDNISGSEGMYKLYGDYIFLTDYNIPCEYLGTIIPI